MTAPWVPMPVQGWPEVAAFLQATGLAWPEAAVVTDLRWHIDQGVPLPGRPVLCRRWGWADWPVRGLLADTARWWDDKKGTRPAPESRDALPRTSRVTSHQKAPVPTRSHQKPPEEERENAESGTDSTSPHQSPPEATSQTPHAGIDDHPHPHSPQEQQGAPPPEPPAPSKPKARKAKAVAPLAAELWTLLRTPEDDLHPSQRWSDAVMAYTRVSGRTEQDARDYAAWVLGAPRGEWCRANIRVNTSLWAGDGAPGRLGEVRAWAGRQRPAAPAPRPTWAALLDRAWDLCPVEGVELEMVAAELAVEGGWPDLVPPEVAAEVAARARRAPPSLFDPHQPPGAAP